MIAIQKATKWLNILIIFARNFSKTPVIHQRHIWRTAKVEPYNVFITLVVESMYTSIDNEQGLEAVRNIFQANPSPRRLRSTYLRTYQGVFQTDRYLSIFEQIQLSPKHIFAGMIKSQITRFYITCSQITDFETAWSVLFNALRKRGYSKRFPRSIKSETLANTKTGNSLNTPFSYDPNIDVSSTQCERPYCPTCEFF